MSTVQETGGLIGVELGILYDSRELERLSGGEIVNEVPSKSEPRPSSNCKSRRVDFLFGFFPPKRVDGRALVGQSSVKVQNK